MRSRGLDLGSDPLSSIPTKQPTKLPPDPTTEWHSPKDIKLINDLRNVSNTTAGPNDSSQRPTDSWQRPNEPWQRPTDSWQRPSESARALDYAQRLLEPTASNDAARLVPLITSRVEEVSRPDHSSGRLRFFDSAKKVAAHLAASIRQISVPGGGVGQSAFEGRVGICDIPAAQIIGKEVVLEFHNLPSHRLYARTSASGTETTQGLPEDAMAVVSEAKRQGLFALRPCEQVGHVNPKVSFLADLLINNGEKGSEPEMPPEAERTDAVDSRVVWRGCLTPQIDGPIICTNQRLFIVPWLLTAGSMWMIRSSGLISLPWLLIDEISVHPTFAPDGSSVAVINTILDIRLKIPAPTLGIYLDGPDAGYSVEVVYQLWERHKRGMDLPCFNRQDPLLRPTAPVPVPHFGLAGYPPTGDLDRPVTPISPEVSDSLMPKALGTGCGHFGVFDAEREYARLSAAASREVALGPTERSAASSKSILCDINVDFSVCSSYPAIIPFPLTDILSSKQIREIASFRSRGRLPVLSWRGPVSSLWRSSQPLSAFGASPVDELLIGSLLDRRLLPRRSEGRSETETRRGKVYIFDARPFVNAFVNKVTGAGFEDTSGGYVGCDLEFASIDNIHKVSGKYEHTIRSLIKLSKELAYSESGGSDVWWNTAEGGLAGSLWSKIMEVGWYDSIDALQRAALRIARHLNAGDSVLVHCSDGWDRTAQLSSLSMLLIDGYYRTIHGFLLLLEKEFLWLGHKAGTRLGNPKVVSTDSRLEEDSDEPPQRTMISPGSHKSLTKKRSEVCPVIIQWLDCVYQWLHLYPDCFEFDEALLLCIVGHLYDGSYGDFLFDNEKERFAFRKAVPTSHEASGSGAGQARTLDIIGNGRGSSGEGLQTEPKSSASAQPSSAEGAIEWRKLTLEILEVAERFRNPAYLEDQALIKVAVWSPFKLHFWHRFWLQCHPFLDA